jgi:hypothetical protein
MANVCGVISMKSDSGQRSTGYCLRDRRYALRHPFAADVAVMDLKSGSLASLSRACAGKTFEVIDNCETGFVEFARLSQKLRA